MNINVCCALVRECGLGLKSETVLTCFVIWLARREFQSSSSSLLLVTVVVVVSTVSDDGVCGCMWLLLVVFGPCLWWNKLYCRRAARWKEKTSMVRTQTHSFVWWCRWWWSTTKYSYRANARAYIRVCVWVWICLHSYARYRLHTNTFFFSSLLDFVVYAECKRRIICAMSCAVHALIVSPKVKKPHTNTCALDYSDGVCLAKKANRQNAFGWLYAFAMCLSMAAHSFGILSLFFFLLFNVLFGKREIFFYLRNPTDAAKVNEKLGWPFSLRLFTIHSTIRSR